MKRTASIVVLGLLVAASVWAQATAQISGRVTDVTGAVLPGAEITATQTQTGISRTTVSNETGLYVLPNLPIGPYRVEVSLPGFKTFVQTDLILQVNSDVVINAALQVGQVTENVEVVANAAMVETRSVGVGQVIENERILELPLNGRQVTELIVLGGAAVPAGTATTRSMPGGAAFSVGGGISSGVAYTLDGAMHNDPSNNLNLPMPFPDALQEFKVETSGLSASNGMHGAASVNSVTKSGTNQFHGDLFEFVRNGVFNARNTFAARRDSLKRNQFGGTLGGPIRENRLFFFGGFQGTITRSDPSEIIRFVPTAAMLAGDFTTVASTACRTTALTLRGTAADGSPLFTGNRTNPANFSPAALRIAAKLPKVDHPCGEIRYGLPEKPNETQSIGKVDLQKSDKHSLFGRVILTTFERPTPLSFSDNILTSTGGGMDSLAQTYTLGDTYLVSTNIVNSLRLAVNRTAVSRVNPDTFSPRDVGIPLFSYIPNYSQINVSNGFNIGNAIQTLATYRTTSYQLAEDISVLKGSHQMSFGVNLAHWRINMNANARSVPDLTFDGWVTNLGLADFLIGRPSQLLQAAPNVLYMNQWYLGVYAQDAWKATSRLTLNYGVRWEPYLPQNVTNERIYNFSEDRFLRGIKSSVFKNAPAGFYYPGDADFPGTSGVEKRWWTFGPRIGLAWDVMGDGKMSVRASYAMAYDFPAGEFHLNTSIAPPWGAETRIPTPVGGLENPYLNWPGGDPFPLVFDPNAAFTRFGPFSPVPPNLKMPTIQTWNLSIQRQVGRDWIVSTSYLGNQSYHLWQTKALNPPQFLGLGPCTLNVVNAQGQIVPQNFTVCSTAQNINSRRKYFLLNPQEGQYIGSLDEYEDGGTQSYHGMVLSASRRAARGVSLSANYTLSHCWGDSNGLASSINPGSNYKFVNDRSRDRGNCASDRRHIFNFTTVAESPRFEDPAWRAIASGWRLSAIYRKSSGNFLTITAGTDRALNGFGAQRGDQILLNPYGDKTINNYLNPLAFRIPDIGTLGNMGPRNIEGVGTWQFDTAISRSFSLTENQRVEFRAEAFNVLNGVRYNNPNTALNSNQFGKITGAADPRIMQFALKYLF